MDLSIILTNIIVVAFSILFFAIFLSVLKDHTQYNNDILEEAVKKVVQLEKLNKDDFKNNEEYYRNIIFEYSPSLLSYIDNFKLDLPRDIIGTLMVLEKKHYIKIDSMILINNSKVKSDFSNLNKLEKYLLENINDGKIVIKKDIVTQIIQNEGIETGILEKKIKKHIIKFDVTNIINTVVIMLVCAIVLLVIMSFCDLISRNSNFKVLIYYDNYICNW